MKRNIPLVTGEVYHILNKSISGYKIFNTKNEYTRMMNLIRYYQIKADLRYSDFIIMNKVSKEGFSNSCEVISKDGEKLVQIIAYCLMPTHIHLILKQLKDNGISDYCRHVLNSYSKYFNAQHQRKGPLWEAKFKNVLVDSDEQLLHLTRYLHLNPVTAKIVNKPENWEYSSYKEYLGSSPVKSMTNFEGIFEIEPRSYKKFVNDRISYQRELAKIKSILID